MQLIGERVYCLDLGSRSALGWNGRSRRSGWIEADRTVEIGPFRIGLPRERVPGQMGDRSSCPLPSIRPDAHFVLEPLDRADPDADPARDRHRIDRPFTTIGRGAECDLRLGDPSLSRSHCILIRLGSELWVVDLMGRGGVEVDARPGRWAPLEHGSRLRVGRSRFMVLREPSPLPLRAQLEGPTVVREAAPSENLPALLSRMIAPLPLEPPTTLAIPPAPEGIHQAELNRLAEAMISPLIDQFTMMQQHMFDQYHHSMMEMIAVFTRLHHEQRGLIDKELRRIRRLTREVRSLRRDLQRQREEMTRAQSRGNGADHPPQPLAIAALNGPDSRGTPEDYRAAQERIIARMTELQEERQGRWRRLLDRIGHGLISEDR